MDQDEAEPKPPEETLFAGEESLLGRPPKVTPAEGIRLMRERLEQLQKEQEELTAAGFNPLNKWYVDAIRQQIHDTQRRLAEYETLARSGNN